MPQPQAYIVAATRTAGGRRNGALKDWHPVDLGAAVLDDLVRRTGIDPAAIDDVVMGCVIQAGEQSMHVGRNAVLASSLPQSVPAVTIDRQCGSSQQAIQFAAQAVMSGVQDIVIAAGVESMTRAPMGLSLVPDSTPIGPWPSSVQTKYGVKGFSQFLGAEIMTDRVHDMIQGLIEDAAKGELEVVIDRKFPLAEAAAAHAYIESRAAVGRVVLVP